MRSTTSGVGWKITGIAVAVGSILFLSAAIGIAMTRVNEPLPTTKPALIAEAPKKVVVIGDSLTGGSADGGNGPANWTALAWNQLRTEGVDIAPEVSGRGGSGYVKRGAEQTIFPEEAARLVKPDDDVVVLFGGTNDFAEPIESTTAAARETITSTRATAPKARLIVVGPVFPPNLEETPETYLAREKLSLVRDAIRREADQANATFVDPIAEQWFADAPQLIGRDHPTDAGHAYMSERLIPVLRSALAPGAVAS